MTTEVIYENFYRSMPSSVTALVPRLSDDLPPSLSRSKNNFSLQAASQAQYCSACIVN